MGIYYIAFLQCGEHRIELCDYDPVKHKLSSLLKFVKDLPSFVSLYPSIKDKLMLLTVITCSTLDVTLRSNETTYAVENDIIDIETRVSRIFIRREMESKAKNIIDLCPDECTNLGLKLSRFNLMKFLIDDLLNTKMPEIPIRIVGPTMVGSITGSWPFRPKPLTREERLDGLELHYQLVIEDDEDENEDEQCQMSEWADNETNIVRLNGHNLMAMKQIVDKHGSIEKLLTAYGVV